MERPKALTRSQILNRDIEGDNLILDPNPLQKTLQTVNIGKLIGRPQQKPYDDPMEDIVDTNPNFDLLRKKVPN